MNTKLYAIFITSMLVTTGLSMAMPAPTSVQFYTDRNAWQAAVNGDIVTEDFDSTAPVYLTQGVNNAGLLDIELTHLNQVNQWNSIDDGSYYFSVNGTPYFRGAFRPVDPDTVIDLCLPSETTAFGGDYISTYSTDGMALRVDGLDFVFSDIMSSAEGTGFLGFITTNAFTTVTLFNPDELYGESFGLDNVSFAAAPETTPIPEPATLLILSLSTVPFIFKRK